MAGKDETNSHRRLENLGFTEEELLETKEIRGLDKTANYWRICRDLVNIRMAPNYRRLFDNPRLEAIDHYEPVPSQQPAPSQQSDPSQRPPPENRFVHAEIQLLAYYETSGAEASPRIIGASKEACFLCDAFIQAHGRFSISKAHRAIMNQWTVPESQDYSPEGLERMQMAITDVNNDVLTETRITHEWRRWAAQSSINLNSFAEKSPPVSIISSVPTKQSSTMSIREPTRRTSTSTVRPGERQGGLTDNGSISSKSSSSSRSSSASTVKPEKEGSSGSAEQAMAHQETITENMLTASGSTQVTAKQSESAQTNDSGSGTAIQQTNKTSRQFPQRSADADATGTNPAVQPPPGPVEANGDEHGQNGRQHSRLSARERRGIARRNASPVRLGGLELFEDLEQFSDCDEASISLVPFSDSPSKEADWVVDARSMAASKDTVIGKASGADGGDLTVRLQVEGYEDAMLMCRWLASEIEGHG